MLPIPPSSVWRDASTRWRRIRGYRNRAAKSAQRHNRHMTCCGMSRGSEKRYVLLAQAQESSSGSSWLTISRSLFYPGRPSAPRALPTALRRSCPLPPNAVPPSASGAQARRGRRGGSEGQGAQGGDARSGMGREMARCGCGDLGDDWSVLRSSRNLPALHAADKPATLGRHRAARAGA